MSRDPFLRWRQARALGPIGAEKLGPVPHLAQAGRLNAKHAKWTARRFRSYAPSTSTFLPPSREAAGVGFYTVVRWPCVGFPSGSVVEAQYDAESVAKAHALALANAPGVDVHTVQVIEWSPFSGPAIVAEYTSPWCAGAKPPPPAPPKADKGIAAAVAGLLVLLGL